MSENKNVDVEARKANRAEVTPVSRVEEQGEALTLTVELPGVAEKSIVLTVENRTLTLEAENEVSRFEGHELVLSEVREVRYRAAFELPERVDPAGIRAACRNGLLVLTLPKREEVKPRRIAVAAG